MQRAMLILSTEKEMGSFQADVAFEQLRPRAMAYMGDVTCNTSQCGQQTVINIAMYSSQPSSGIFARE